MKKGDRYRGFRVERATKIDEINIRVLEILHESSGAKVVAVEAQDEENLFAITLNTYPNDDTGVAHILEHTVLCGSEKYPVRDPFFCMLRRSSNTFMNAFTSKLWTAYPAASKIPKDFNNLLSVYLDAVFHPLLTKESFLQEGHRLEFEEPENPESNLLCKGVVYNEMKGVFSSPTSFLWRKMMSGLCEGHPYGYDSGGDPEAIPHLTHEQLKKFHEDHYHPSRASFFFYGQIPVENHLDIIADAVLDKAEKRAPIPPVPKMKRFSEPKRETASYPTHETDLTKKTFVGFSWLTVDIKDQDDLLAFALVDSILMDTDASLLKHRLINSGLCVQADSSYDPDARDVPYSIVCKGSEEGNAQLLEDLIYTSLKEIVAEKIPHQLIESSMHQLEFSRSEISCDQQPYALEIFGRTILSCLQGGPLLDGLKIHSLFDKLAKLVSNENYLPGIIQKYLIDNPHMYRLVMVPDPTMLEKVQKKENENLAEQKKSLSESEKEAIVKESEHLKLHQDGKADEDVSCLPILSLNDITKEVTYYPIEKVNVDSLAVYHHATFTNDITYLDLLFDLPQIDEEDLPYLRLFASLLPELGAGNRSYVDNLNYIHQNIGGIWTSLSLNVQRKNTQTCYPTISICAKSLSRKNESMCHILKDFVLTPDLKDAERIRELICQSYASLQNRINTSAIWYALTESAAGFSPWNHVNNIWHGLPHYKFIEKLAKNIDSELDKVIEKFDSLASSIFHLNNPHIITTCDQKTYEDLEGTGFYGLSKFSEASGSYQPWVELAMPKPVESSVKYLASPIAHNAHSIATVNMSSPHAPALKLASYLCENLEIHKRVREQGGAYTSGVKFNILIGNYQFYSSRDPNVYSTYSAFQKAVDRLAEGLFSELDLHEAKLNYIQDFDGVVPPGARTSVTYFQHKVGLTREIRQEFRDRILATTKEEVVIAVRECLVPKMKSHSVRISYANKEIYERDLPLFEQSGLPNLEVSSL